MRVDGRAYRGFNFFSQDDQRLLEVLTHGEFCISGLRNKSLRSQLPDLNSGQISRMLQRPRHLGKQVLTTGAKLKDLFLIPQLAPET